MKKVFVILLLNLLLFTAIYQRSLAEYFELKYHKQIPPLSASLQAFARLHPSNLQPALQQLFSKYKMLLSAQDAAQTKAAEPLKQSNYLQEPSAVQSADLAAPAQAPAAPATTEQPVATEQPTAPAAPKQPAEQQNAPEKLAQIKTQESPQKPAPPASEPTKLLSAKHGVILIGDSLMQGLGAKLCAKFKPLQLPCINLAKQSSGLLHTRFYDARRLIAQQLKKRPKAAVIALFGANDLYDAPVHGGKIPFGSDEWLQHYLSKIRALGRLDLLIQLPPMREDKNAAQALWFNAALAPELAQMGIKTVQLLEGEFAYYQRMGGRAVRLRAGDGTHFTARGYELLAERLFAQLAF